MSSTFTVETPFKLIFFTEPSVKERAEDLGVLVRDELEERLSQRIEEIADKVARKYFALMPRPASAQEADDISAAASRFACEILETFVHGICDEVLMTQTDDF